MLTLIIFFALLLPILFLGVFVALFEAELPGIVFSFLFTPVVLLLLGVGIAIDRKLRKKFNLMHKKMFSLAWTALSITALSVFTVFVIIICDGILPMTVLVYELLVYLLLSALIIFCKIKKIVGRKNKDAC